MKQKNYKWVIYTVLFILIGAVLFLSFKDITPIAKRVEQDISVIMR